MIVIPVFTAGRLGPTHVSIESGVAGLRRSGILFCEEITTLDKDFLRRGPLGTPASGAFMDEVLLAVRRAIGDQYAFS